MPDVLIIGDTFRSPELRHEVPLGVPDPFVYLERDGVRQGERRNRAFAFPADAKRLAARRQNAETGAGTQ